MAISNSLSGSPSPFLSPLSLSHPCAPVYLSLMSHIFIWMPLLFWQTWLFLFYILIFFLCKQESLHPIQQESQRKQQPDENQVFHSLPCLPLLPTSQAPSYLAVPSNIFKGRQRQSVPWHFHSVLSLTTEHPAEQNPAARGRGKNQLSKWGLNVIGLQNASLSRDPCVICIYAGGRAIPAVCGRLCKLFPSLLGVHSKQITRLLPLE